MTLKLLLYTRVVRKVGLPVGLINELRVVDLLVCARQDSAMLPRTHIQKH